MPDLLVGLDVATEMARCWLCQSAERSPRAGLRSGLAWVSLADEEGERSLWQGSEVAQSAGERSSYVGDQASQQADDEVSQTGEHLGSMPLSYLGAVFIDSDVADPVQAVLDAPVAAIEFQ